MPHALSKEEAKKRLETLLVQWGEKHGIQATWSGDRAEISGKAMGISVDAQVEVFEGKVSGEGPDPGLLLRSKAQKYLTSKLTELLS